METNSAITGMLPVERPRPGKSRIGIKTILIQIALLSIFWAAGHAQQKEISIRAFPSSWYNHYYEPGFDGMGIAFTYHPIVNKTVKLNVTGEFSVLRSRNEFLAGFGINSTFWQAEHFRISVDANLLSGIDLYRPAPYYVGGVEAGVRLDYYLRKQLSVFLSAHARTTWCPAYADIGPAWHSSWPLAVGLRF